MKLKKYLVVNRATNESHEVEALYAQDACEKLGWMIGECWIKERKEEPSTYDKQEEKYEYPEWKTGYFGICSYHARKQWEDER